MLNTKYLRSVGIDESTLRRIERDNTYKEQYSESMRDEWCYQDEKFSLDGQLVSGKSEGLDFIDIDDLEGSNVEYDYNSAYTEF